MKNIIGSAIAKIKNQNIVPVPRWRYLMRKYAVWSVFFLTVLFGAISFSVALDMLSQLDWDLYRFAHQSALVYSLTLLPYFWMVFITLFLSLAFFDLRKTETGYKYGWLKMSLISIGGIILTGAIFSLIGLGGRFNRVFVRDVPYYGQHMMMTKESQWMKPDSGFLAGSLSFISNDRLEISDLSGKRWNILLDEKTFIRPMVNISHGEMIKVIGVKKDEGSFQAIEIRPWMGQGMRGPGQGTGMMNGSGSGEMRRN